MARSALSAILPQQMGKSFGQDQNVTKLLKGVFRLHPTLPKYTVTYDPDIVLTYINSLPKNSELMLELLTKSYVCYCVYCVGSDASP